MSGTVERRVEECVEDAIRSFKGKYNLKCKVTKVNVAGAMTRYVKWVLVFPSKTDFERLCKMTMYLRKRLLLRNGGQCYWENDNLTMDIWNGYYFTELSDKRIESPIISIMNDIVGTLYFSSSIFSEKRDNPFVEKYEKRTGFKCTGSLESDIELLNNPKYYPEFCKKISKIH